MDFFGNPKKTWNMFLRSGDIGKDITISPNVSTAYRTIKVSSKCFQRYCQGSNLGSHRLQHTQTAFFLCASSGVWNKMVSSRKVPLIHLTYPWIHICPLSCRRIPPCGWCCHPGWSEPAVSRRIRTSHPPMRPAPDKHHSVFDQTSNAELDQNHLQWQREVRQWWWWW